ncbi:MAG: hypothetical protein WB462_14610 [Solirubrobacterales bacterium]
MKLKLILTTAIVGAALALPGISSAWAQAPPNDTFEQATVISSLPFSQILDTSEATTDSTDAEALASCGVPSITFAATVWYEYTPPVDQSLVISTSGSSYSAAGVAVLTGSPGSLFAVTCSLGFVTFSATAGQTYHILVADIGGGSGGTLNLSVETTPEFELSVDRFGQFDPKTGVATVTGTLTCPSGSTGTVFFGTLSQRTTTAETFPNPIDVPCSGVAQQWSIAFTPLDGKFKGGPADVSVDAFVCFSLGCLIPHADQSLILRGRTKGRSPA